VPHEVKPINAGAILLLA